MARNKEVAKRKNTRWIKLMPLAALAVALAAGYKGRQARTVDMFFGVTTRTVNSTADTTDGSCTTSAGGCTLREAVAASAPNDIINFDSTVFPASGTTTITLGTVLDIIRGLTINGPGAKALALSGNRAHTVLTTQAGTIKISGLTIKDGSTSVIGGGIVNGASLTLTECLFSQNFAVDDGGAIATTSTGNLTINRCLFHTNTSTTGEGGAVYSLTPNTNIYNSTFYNNTAVAEGGAIVLYGSSGKVVNCTITGNGTENGFAGGIFADQPAAIINNIIALNFSNLDDNFGNGIVSYGYNLVGTDNMGSFGATGDVTGVTLTNLVNDLGDNGGPTNTFALKAGSAALDAGGDLALSAPFNLTLDQRGTGFVRKYGSHVDIGAFEYQPTGPGPATHFSVSAPPTATAGTAFSVTVTALDASNATATGYTGTVHFTSTDTDAQVVLPNDYTFTGPDAGVHTFTSAVTLRTAGSKTVTATDTVSSSINGTSSGTTVSLPTEPPGLDVNTTSDVVSNTDFQTSLREAITYAATLGGTPEITFNNTVFAPATAPHVINLTLGKLTVANNLTITGPGSANVSISGDTNSNHVGDVPLLAVTAGSLTVSGVNCTEGKGVSNFAPIDIAAGATLAMNNCVITNCVGQAGAQGTNGDASGNPGGAGLAALISRGTLALTECSFTGNTGGNGGNGGNGFLLGGSGGDSAAAFVHNGTSLTVTRCTLANNVIGVPGTRGSATGATSPPSGAPALSPGGSANGTAAAGSCIVSNNNASFINSTIASNNGFGLVGNTLLALVNCTVTGNAGGGVKNTSTVSLSNCLLAGNTGSDLTNSGTLQGDYNLIQTSSATFTTGGTHNIRGQAALFNVAGLIDNGGPTKTIALQEASPAVNAGDDAVLDAPYSLATDQRGAGYDRKKGSHIDIGAFEVTPTSETPSLVVDTTNDVVNNTDNLTSLREAIAYAATLGGTPEITFDAGISGGTITLGGTELSIGASMTITGPEGGITIGGNNASRVFNIDSGTVTLSDLTVTGGNATNGGGITNFGSLTLSRCTIAGNTVTGDGGGVYSTGSVTATNCTFHNNHAYQAGGLGVESGSALVVACTFTGNTGRYSGGGIASQTGVTMTLYNSILAGNAAQYGPDYASFAAVTSLGHNLLGVDGGFNAGLTNGTNHDIVGADWKTVLENNGTTATLADNGGPTHTIALKAGSPALEAGDDAVLDVPYSLATDQRGTGYDRKSGNHVDIGAYETHRTAEAASLVVDTTSDVTDIYDNLTSLREALAYAATLGGTPEITFDSTVFATAGGIQTIHLTQGALEVGHDLTITSPGSGTVSVSGDADNDHVGDVPLLLVTGGTVTINGLTLTEGQSDVDSAAIDTAAAASLTLNECVVSNNVGLKGEDGASGMFGETGEDGSPAINLGGTTILNACSFTGNTGGGGGGGGLGFAGGNGGNAGAPLQHSGTSLTMTRCTFAQNSSGAPGEGGFGIYFDGHDGAMSATCLIMGNASFVNSTIAGNAAYGIVSEATLGMVNCTVTGNTQLGLWNTSDGTATLTNCILSGNEYDVVNKGTLQGDYNLIWNTSAVFTTGGAHNIIGQDALFDTHGLSNNSGPTRTIALQNGSPARNAGDDSVLSAPNSLTTDQRGGNFKRKRGAHVDMGALEMRNDAPSATAQSVTAYTNVPKTITLAGTDPNGDPLSFRLASRPAANVRLYNGPTTSSPLIGSGAILPAKLAGNTITYLAPVGFSGADSFTFVAEDGEMRSTSATVSINVQVPVPPTVTITNPTANQVFTAQALTAVNGTVTDNTTEHAGIQHVSVLLYRHNIANTGYEYWNGTDWTLYATSTAALAGGSERSVTIDGSNWSVDAAALPSAALTPGAYLVRVQATDNIGAMGNAVFRTFTSVAPNPDVTITTPAVNTVITGAAITAVGGTVTDYSSTGIKRVLAYLYRRNVANTGYEYWNGTAWTLYASSTAAAAGGAARATTVTDGNWSVDAAALPSTALAPGTYYVLAQASDNRNVSGSTVFRTFTAKDAPPSLTIDHPTANQSLTDSALPAIDGTVTDNTVSHVGINRVEVYLFRTHSGGGYDFWNGTAWTFYSTSKAAVAANARVAAVVTGNAWSCAAALPAGLPDSGNYTVWATAIDNSGASSTQATARFTMTNGKPTVTIDHPTQDQNLGSAPLSRVDGTVTDFSPSHVGINKVVLALYRAHTGGGSEYWTGSTWTYFTNISAAMAGGGALSTTIVSAGGGDSYIWRCTATLPTTLEAGAYHARAYAIDNSNVTGPAVGVNFTSTNTAHAPAGPSGLSTASASAALGTVTLTFSLALDAESAADASHYNVTVNGQTAVVQGVSVSGSRVVLMLENGLQSGNQVQVAWNGLANPTGRTLSGTTGTLTAQ